MDKNINDSNKTSTLISQKYWEIASSDYIDNASIRLTFVW